MSLVPLPRAAVVPGSGAADVVDVSIVIPIYNEEANIVTLFDRLLPVLDRLPSPFEVIAVNDGSRDGSLAQLRRIAELRPEVRVVDFRRNFGQTAAMMAGIDFARGRIVVSIDADLQNDPEDIPILLDKLAEGYDVVSGWRRDRKDAALRRNFVSRVANALISRISGVQLNDYGCTLKAYRRDVLAGMRLYGEMHRFIPIYASWMGARVIELPVRHHARHAGESKYGLERIAKVILDLIVVKFLDRYFVKPIYVFGGFGLLCLLAALLSFAYMLYLRIVDGYSMILTPLPVLTALLVSVGVISILLGLVAEMVVRTYFESQNRPAYNVRELINFARDS
jgi:dolichol-phosphate mannosyltransferase